MSRYEIRLSGSGGQGMITAGIILAKAASIEEGKNAVQSQSYGPEARGGASKAEVIISDEEINYPKVASPHMLVALTQEAYDKYSTDIRKGGLIITDSLMVREVKKGDFRSYGLPIISSVTEKLGKSLSANIAALAALNALGAIIGKEALLKTVLSMIPKGTEEANKLAFQIGEDLALEALR